MKMIRNIVFGVLCFFAATLSVYGAQGEGSTRRFGIFIGSNNGGRDRVRLRYAVSDASSVSKVFNEMGGIADEDTILLVEPNIRDINRRIDVLHEQVVRSKEINKRTEIVFYYSGHSDEDGLLLNRERYPYRQLRDRINDIPSDMRIVILDSCASGAFTRLKGGAKTQPFLMDSSITADGYAFLTSSSADEASQESDKIASSYFTHSLVTGLRGAADSVGDGRVTLNELYRFAYAETLSRTETSIYGSQHPSYDIQISGTGDLVLTDIKETSAGVVFDEKLTGRLSIRNISDHLIAEITKTARTLELGLEPGFYRVTLQQGSDLLRAEFTLVEGKRVIVTRENFVLIDADPARRRGSEEYTPPVRGTSLYTFFINNVYEPFRFPLIGFVNIARGNHDIAQVGFINWNTGNFSGVQASYINTVGGDFNGAQFSFINTVAGNFNGFQSSFINTVVGDTKGVQFSFINTAVGEVSGMQFAFINTAVGELKGPQFGFINTAVKSATGPQVGFFNTAVKPITGLQVGFINIAAQGIKGPQFGFFNYADSIENGIPIGFLSIVRKGGYHAIEYGFSEFFTYNVALKLGVEKFYNNIFISYNQNDEFKWGNFAQGLGFGSILPIGKIFFFNPELNFYTQSQSKRDDENRNVFVIYSTLSTAFGVKLGKHFSISAGPSLTLVNAFKVKRQRSSGFEKSTDEEIMPDPLFSLFTHDINEYNRIVIGARAFARLIF